MNFTKISASKIRTGYKIFYFNSNQHIILIIIILLIKTLSAQINTTVEVSSWYDDNLYRSPEKVEDVVSNIDLEFNYQPDDEKLNLYYNGSYLLYNEFNTRNFYLNALGLNFVKNMDQDELYTVYLGADWTLRSNNEDYNYYDYNQIYAYANLSLALDWFYLKTGYNYRYRNYTNIPDLNNHQHYGFMQINRSFETRSTIILESDLGYKSFAGQNYTTTEGSMSTGGQGHGRMTQVSTVTNTTTTLNEIPSLSHVILLARVAQSLHTRIGIFVQYRKQISLTKETSYVNSDDYYQDEELFDDPFSYESDTYSSQLSWILPWQMKIQLGGAVTSKNYISEIAYSSIDDTTGLAGVRADDQNSYYINFTKIFHLNKNWINTLQFNLNYGYIRNKSNSYWYDYDNKVISSSIEWTF